MSDLFLNTGASISPCGKYRYKLWRYWNISKPHCLFIMLNPPTADEVKNDPTVERCERRARRLGFGGLMICNLFAFRAADPQEMKEAVNPIGLENDINILTEARRADMIICGWGEHGGHKGRSKVVINILRKRDIPLYYLRLNKSGEPQHPLYIGYDQEPQLWKD